MSLTQALLAAALVCAAPTAGFAQSVTILNNSSNHSVVLTAGVVTQVLAAVPANYPRTYERVINVGTAGTAWCSRFDPAPAANKAGSFPISYYGNGSGEPSVEEFSGADFVPQHPLYCTADSGTATLTVEVSP